MGEGNSSHFVNRARRISGVKKARVVSWAEPGNLLQDGGRKSRFY